MSLQETPTSTPVPPVPVRRSSPLTRKQRHVLTAIQRFSTINGYMPSVRELGRELGGLAPATVQHHVTVLRRKGFLEHDGGAHGIRLSAAQPSQAPATRVTDDVRSAGDGGGGDGNGGGSGRQAWGLEIPGMQVVVPLLGTIAAGKPLEAVEQSDEYIPIPASLARGGTFALRVAGQSMVEDAILDGDLVIVQACARVENGEAAVVLLPDGTATLKRWHAEKDGIRLQPANSAMEPLVLRGEQAKDVRIRGRVIGLIRQFE